MVTAFFVVAVLLFATVFPLSAEVHSDDASKSNEQIPYEVAAKKDGDRVDVLPGPNRATFTITSHTGIGGATIRRTTNDWPTTLTVRAHLSGLESLSVSNGKVRLHISVLSHSGHARLLHLWKQDKEGPQLDKGSPFWTEIGIFNADGKRTENIPNKGGYFELALPNALFKDNPESLHLDWIDFYRG